MHRRLSLAVLLLSASLCGMGEDPKQIYNLKAKKVLTALAEMAVCAAQLSDFGVEDTLEGEDADPDQSDEQDGNGSAIAQQARKRSSSGSSSMGCMGSSSVAGIGFSVLNFSGGRAQKCFFPGEQGEGYLNV